MDQSNQSNVIKWKYILSLLTLLFVNSFFVFCGEKNIECNSKSKVELVDMFMGVQNSSNCVIGPQLPHGSVNPAPQTPNGGQNGYDSKDPIRGFGQLHVSGIGWGRYGQIFISPQIGFNSKEDGHDSPKSNEIASPYYYGVKLNRYNVKAELTPTHNCVSYRFTFPTTKKANILLDIAHNIPQHIVPIVGGYFVNGEIVYDENKNQLTGWGEYVGGFGSKVEPYKVFFAIDTNIKFKEVKITNKENKALYAQLKLPNNPGTVLMNVGISMKSIKNAKAFLKSEIAGSTFEELKNKAKSTWGNVFSKIEVEGGTFDEQRLFYTTMYHSQVMPRIRTNDNPHWDSELPHIDDHYCIWDTWRTKYPLMTLIEESFVANTVNSFIDRFAHNGKCMPTFTSSLEWDWKQGGDDVDNVIADAFAKDVKGFDRSKAYELIKHNAFHERSKDYIQHGWESEPAEKMSCSYTMEYAYNDFCGAEVAKAMNDHETSTKLEERSGKWINLFNPDLVSFGFKGFIAPKKSNGDWIDINPAEKYGSWTNYFYEGNSWVYSLFTPHQYDRLIELCGGKKAMIERLTFGFDNKLIELDNEPGFLSPFIFTHCGRADLTAKYVNLIRREHFSLTTGYPENEDSGAMGSWYVFSSIGFFPNAGQDIYYLLPPAFENITITRENGKKINIETIKMSPDAKSIYKVNINGKDLDRSFIYHNEIAEGATIIYTLK